MSADNGIYIGRFPKTANPYNVKLHEADVEYRVIHAQAIDNLDFKVPEDMDYNPREVMSYFENAPVFADEKSAVTEAYRMYKEQMESDCPIVEYGISEIRFSQPYQFYVDHAHEIVYKWD